MRNIVTSGLFFCALHALAAEPGQPLPFERGRWALSGEAKIETYLGRSSLRLRTGEAIAADVRFKDGTLEFDMAVGTRRNFPRVELRRAGEGEYEEFYFRTHKSELPDAIQYVPAWQGAGGWQLYHGPGFTAKAAFPREQWIPVRIVLAGDRAAVFVGRTGQPQLVVSRLRREPRGGGLAFGATLPKGSAPDGEYTAAVSNVVLRPDVVPFDFSKAPPTREDAPPGVVGRWELSAPFVPAEGAIRALPDVRKWKNAPAEPSGLVVVERWVERPAGTERPAILARVVVESAEETTKRFHFGYSDEITVFLNARPLFSGDAHYSFDAPRQEGLIGLSQGTLYLPLRKGKNELVLAVADVFGGWGLMGRFDDPSGLRMAP